MWITLPLKWGPPGFIIHIPSIVSRFFFFPSKPQETGDFCAICESSMCRKKFFSLWSVHKKSGFLCTFFELVGHFRITKSSASREKFFSFWLVYNK